ncbi:MAG TPA: FecR domain-containing protein [Rhizomicrobium sp.]|nr:FecR domain-containing protein [Rhizomicrobium sp.]
MSNNGKILAFPDMAVLDAEAAAWVARFDAGDVSAKDQAAFQAWLNRSALHREAIAEYGNFWSEFDQLGQLTASIGAEREIDTQAKRSFRFSGTKYWLAASVAAVVVIGAVGGVLRQELSDRPSTQQASVQQATVPRPSVRQSYATAIGAQKKFTLADGSVVTLNTNSRIDVELRGHRRDVHLVRGEAYFDVVHDTARPFTVYANRYVVRDIGTAFAVHLLEKGLVNVRVTKGSVEIAASTPGGKVSDGTKSLGVIAAGRDVVFGQTIERSELVSDAELGRKLAWRQGQLIYSGQPLADVLADLSRYSDIEIELADPALRNLSVGGAFSVNQTDAIFAALENNFGVHAEWIDTRHVRLTLAGDKDSSGR